MTAKGLTSADITRMHDLSVLGMNNIEIAGKFGVDESTVRYHLKRPRPVEEDPEEVKEEKALKMQVCDMLRELAEETIAQTKAVKEWNISKPSDILKALEVAVNALGMMYALSPEDAGGNNTSGGSPASRDININQLKVIRNMTPEQRKAILDELNK